MFDPHNIDERALKAYLSVARGTQEAALASLHASGYDVGRALLAGATMADRPTRPTRPNGPHVGQLEALEALDALEARPRPHARPRTAAEWRCIQARLNARRDPYDEAVVVWDAVLLRSHAKLPYVGRVERVCGDHVKVRWFYRRGDLSGRVRADANELFLSSHTDTNHVSAIVGRLGTFRELWEPARGAPFCRRAVCYPASAEQMLVCMDRP